MPQHRLSHYFHSYPPFVPSAHTFYSLPQSVRQLIYFHAGLKNLLVDLNYTNLRVYQNDTYPDTLYCQKLDTNSSCEHELRKLDVVDFDEVWEIAHRGEEDTFCGRETWGTQYGRLQSLLLVSKQIHEEVEAFVYSGAIFRVCMGQPLGLKRLWRMRLSNVSSLTIRLDVPKTVIESGGWADSFESLEYIDMSNSWGKTVLKNWTVMMERLAKEVQPGQLRLSVAFRARTLDEVRAAIEPMFRLPRLKDCGLRVQLYGESRHWQFQNVSCAYITYATFSRVVFADSEGRATFVAANITTTT